jgi:hypothetical protein
MMVDDETWTRIQEAYAFRGYLVLGYENPRALGEVITRLREGELPQPFRIVAVTSREEYLEQACKSVREMECPREAYFYRAVTE